MVNLIIVGVLVVLAWNVKQGFERIEERLNEINETLKKNNSQ